MKTPWWLIKMPVIRSGGTFPDLRALFVVPMTDAEKADLFQGLTPHARQVNAALATLPKKFTP